MGSAGGTEPPVRTRCGYLPNECLRTFEKALGEAGPISTGRALHFAADIVCSGGIDSFLRSLWDYATGHIGLASPRIFVYLKRRTEELQDILRRLPDENAYGFEEFQIRVGELVLVSKEAPTRTAVSWPKVGSETHTDGWIRSIGTGAPETAALRRVWRPEGDLSILRTVGAEICKAIGDGTTARALFWIKWLFEEEAKTAKEVKGASLTTIDRGDGGKKGATVGGFVVALLAEIYKELAAKEAIRMKEEFQILVDLWRQGDKHIHGTAKKHILVILVQMVCEVPRWKVPAAQSLIKDPVAMAQAIRQVPKFFREVLSYDAPRGSAAIVKAFRTRGKVDSKAVAAAKKGDAHTSQMDAFERAMEDYFNRA